MTCALPRVHLMFTVKTRRKSTNRCFYRVSGSNDICLFPACRIRFSPVLGVASVAVFPPPHRQN